MLARWLRRPAVALALIAVLASGGCASLARTKDYLVDGGVTQYRGDSFDVVYAGTKDDVKSLYFADPLALIDLPFSFVVDTALLPITLPVALWQSRDRAELSAGLNAIRALVWAQERFRAAHGRYARTMSELDEGVQPALQASEYAARHGWSMELVPGDEGGGAGFEARAEAAWLRKGPGRFHLGRDRSIRLHRAGSRSGAEGEVVGVARAPFLLLSCSDRPCSREWDPAPEGAVSRFGRSVGDGRLLRAVSETAAAARALRSADVPGPAAAEEALKALEALPAEVTPFAACERALLADAWRRTDRSALSRIAAAERRADDSLGKSAAPSGRRVALDTALHSLHARLHGVANELHTGGGWNELEAATSLTRLAGSDPRSHWTAYGYRFRRNDAGRVVASPAFGSGVSLVWDGQRVRGTAEFRDARSTDPEFPLLP